MRILCWIKRLFRGRRCYEVKRVAGWDAPNLNPISRQEARYILMTAYDGDMAACGKRPDITLSMARALNEVAEG